MTTTAATRNFFRQEAQAMQAMRSHDQKLVQALKVLHEKYGATAAPMMIHDELILEFPESVTAEQRVEAMQLLLKLTRPD